MLGQGFCDHSVEALILKCVTMGGGGLKIVQNYVTSFMDDPFSEDKILQNLPDGWYAVKTSLVPRLNLLFLVRCFSYENTHLKGFFS